MNSLTKGDPITIVMVRLDRSAYTRLAVYHADDRSVWASGWRDLRAEDEGIDWIHGHHDPDSPEAKALLAAFALVTRR